MKWKKIAVIPAAFGGLRSGNPGDGGTAFGLPASPRKRGQNEKTAPKGRSVSVLDLYQFDPD
jgi:hypothetical protein